MHDKEDSRSVVWKYFGFEVNKQESKRNLTSIQTLLQSGVNEMLTFNLAKHLKGLALA